MAAPVIVYNPGSTTPVVGGGSNAISTNFNTLSGAILNKAVFGIASGEGINIGAGGFWDFNYLTDPAARAAALDINFAYVRFNGISQISQMFGANATNAPNWTATNQMIAGINQTFPNAQFCMNGFNHDTFALSNSTLRTNIANAFGQWANRLKTNGVNINYWEPVNEPNQPTAQTAVDVASMTAACLTPIHNVDANYKIGGPAVSFESAGTPAGDYVQRVAAAGGQFISYHAYVANPGAAGTDAQLYQTGFDWAANASNAQTHARAGASGNYQTFLSEYNIDFYNPAPPGGAGMDVRQQNYKGAVFISLVMIGSVYKGLAGSGMWRFEIGDGLYGIFTSGYVKNPNGAWLKASNQYLGGNVTTTTVTSTGTTKLMVMNSVTPTGFGMVIINWDTATSWTGSVTLTGRHQTNAITRWDLTSTSPLGVTSSITPPSPTGALTSITVPAASITILSGLLDTGVVTPPTDPPPSESPTGVRVTWTNSAIGTQPVNNNTQHRVTGQPSFSDNALGTTTSATQDLTGLTPATQYDIRVKAANLAGVVFSTQVQHTTPAVPSGVVQFSAGTGGSFTDASGVVWTISAAGRCTYNGTEDMATGSVILMALINGTAIWQENSAGNWYTKNATASPVQDQWANGSNPL